jgi:TPR repeat protein
MGRLDPALSRPRLLIVKASLRVVGIALGIILGLQVGCGAPESLRAKAEKGDANAQLELGFMYYRGEGVPKDYVEAYEWFTVAARGGFAEAEENQRTLAVEMSGTQIVEALRLSREFRLKKTPP